jgi:predicted alpha/beta-hydrolase family hydrolase
MTTADVMTPQGLARVHLHPPEADPRAVMVLGHGAGGGVSAPDLTAVTALATARGILVALVEQPYRVAGRRSPPPPARLDPAWIAAVAHVTAGAPGLPLVTGGRSSGARVACRTAQATGSAGVLCLAFPLQPRSGAGRPPRPSRLPELEGVPCPVLVVQGERDAFGIPPEAPGRTVARIAGDHSLRSDVEGLRAAVGGWLDRVLGG